MAYSQTDLDAIRTAIARGERTVRYLDREVTYRSMDELLAAEARITRALAAASPSTTSKQSIGVAFKGL